MKKQTVRDLTHIAIVAALYVVLTVVPPFNGRLNKSSVKMRGSTPYGAGNC